MVDRALFAAFQKVKNDVESALEVSREKQAQETAKETKERFEKKKGSTPPASSPAQGRLAQQKGKSKAQGATRLTAQALDQLSARGLGQGQRFSDSTPKASTRVRAPRNPMSGQARTQGRSTKPSAHVAPLPRDTKVTPRLSYSERRNPIPPFELTPHLPVSERAAELIEAIQKHAVIIVCGETGSGKTTQLPKIALMAGRGQTGRIGHTQPRRIAASSIAKRIAEELKTPVGDVVGFKVRFTDHTAPGASIKLMTDGILLAETQNDPLLKAYDTIIIDEAHERSINIDFLLGYLKKILVKRPDLKVIVTSATIDAERFAKHFAMDGQPAPIYTISGRTYPVEIRYRPMDDVDEDDDHTMLAAIDQAVSELEQEGRGDILIFFSGEREIREAQDYLRKTRVGKVELLPLYARLSAADQEKVFKPGALRRIILSTNVAETSVTVPGIRYVIDTGVARVKRYSYRSKVEQLLIEPISQASANQRAGRCGRVSDGICIRLYSKEDFERRPLFNDPEIVRTNLAAVILKAASLRLGDIRAFPFVEAPSNKAIADGYNILQELNAMTESAQLTSVGHALAKLPIDPKLARILLAGSQWGALQEMLIIASGLSIQDPRERPLDAQQQADQAHREFNHEKSDFLSYVNLWHWVEKARSQKESNRKFEQELKRRFLSPRRLREWKEVYNQLAQLVAELNWRVNTAPATYEEVHKSLLTGLLGSIGLRNVESDPRLPPYSGARGIKYWIWPGSVRAKKGGRWILAGQIVETSKLYARCVAEIEPTWIEAVGKPLMKQSWTEPHWEKMRGEVMAMERGTLYGLTIYQNRSVNFAPHDPKLAREIFIRQALVEENLAGSFAFYQHNQKLVADIIDLEHKTRRPDVLVDDELIFQFYDGLIPSDVYSQKTLEKWLKTLDKEAQKKLYLTKDALMRHDASGAAIHFFPKKIEIAGVSMPLSYHFEPGSPRDGVTLTVPLFALNQVDAVKTEWLVPGMIREKAQTLLKTLPQKIRRHCVPLPDYAKAFVGRLAADTQKTYESKPFVKVLAQDIKEQLGVACEATDFKLEQLPAHLFMNFKVVDEHGRQLELSRYLADLRAQLGQQAQEVFREVAQQYQVSDVALSDQVTSWSFGQLPELMEIQRNGQTLIGHPALVDQGDYCSIEVFDDLQQAQKAHLKGLRALFKLNLKEQVRFIEKQFKTLGKVQMQANAVPGLSKTFASIEVVQQDVVDGALNATALQTPLPCDEQSFQARREEVKNRLGLVAQDIARLLVEIVELANQVALKLKRFSDEKSLYLDVFNQLEALFPAHFLVEIPFSQVKHYPRYLKAILYRLDRYHEDRSKDLTKQNEIEKLMQPWQRLVRERKGQLDDRLIDFRWLLEELRVSLFAQQLKTPMPVSPKRLERVWHTIVGY